MSISPSTSFYEVSSYPFHSPAIFLERSTIQESRYGNDNTVPPLFSHRHSELADDERSMTGDQPLSPRQRTNPMSVSALCDPPSHSIPPQLARNEARMTHSPSSSLSSPPHTPPSPSIEVIDVPADLTGAPSPLPANVVAESSASVTSSTSRKRRRDDSEQPQTPVLPPDEYDERTKTWKHATGFRKDLTADKLTQPDAPTRRKRRSAAFLPAAVAQEPAYNSSQHSGSGESANEEEDELRETADVAPSGRISGASGTNRDSNNNNDEGATAADIDPNEAARLEKKRRQNTQAARRSRIRKAEEVQKLQNRVAELEAEVIAGRHRLTDASRDATRLDVLHRNEVEFTGILKNSILNLVGDQKGSEAIAQATQRWRAITSPVSPSAASMPHLHNEQFSDMEYEFETKSGARAGS